MCATNANIEKKIENNEFRNDLYYRLNTIPIKIPPLKQRKEEILGIAEQVLKDTCKEYELESKTLSKDAQNALLDYDYPGNIRELISIVQRACILNENAQISSDDLFLDSRVKREIPILEKELIIEVLSECKNDLKKSAAMLGMNETTLKEKMQRYDLVY